MRHIVKGRPPASIVPYRNDETTDFDDFPDHGAVRTALAQEQRYLCCYCLRRIKPVRGSMKVEHWASQVSARERRFDWNNLLGACMGGEGNRPKDQHCDTRKGSTSITVNPTDPSHIARIRFRGDGTIESRDAAIQADIALTLNLNHVLLVRARKSTIASVLEAMCKQHPGKWSREALRSELRRWRERTETEQLPEFSEAVAQVLERRLNRPR